MGRDPHNQKPQPFAAAAARVCASVGPDSTIALEFNVTKDDVAIGYMSQDPFFDSFEEEAWAAFELRASDMHEMHTKRISDTSKSISDMQVKLQSSFDWMKYLEKNVQAHLEERLPVILTAVVDKALAPTLTTVLADCLPSTFTSVLKGSMADFQSRFGSADSVASTQHVRELLEAATDARICEHSAVMLAIEDIGTRVSALDDAIASSEAHTPVAAPPPPPPPVAVRPAVPTGWGHNFYPTGPQPPAPLHSWLMQTPQVAGSRHLAPSIRLGVREPWRRIVLIWLASPILDITSVMTGWPSSMK